MNRFITNIVFVGLFAAQFAPVAVFAQAQSGVAQISPIVMLRALFKAVSPVFTTERRGGGSTQPIITRAPETIDEMRVECLKGASADLGFISDGIQKFVDATPVECSNLAARLFAQSTRRVGSELRLATRPVFQALSSLRNIMRIGLGVEFPKRVGRLTAAFNPEKLSQLSVARPDARPAFAAVVSAAEQGGVTLGKDTFDALNNEMENAIKKLDAQIKAKEAELAGARDAGVRSALERELRLLRFQRDTIRNTKEVKDAIHECRISRNDQGEFDPFLEFNRFRKAIADMILQTFEPIVAAMGSSDSTKRRIQSLADNVGIWGDGGTEKTGKPGTNRGTRIESLMDAYNDALPPQKLGGGIADIFLAFVGLLRELFDAVGVTDLFEQIGRIEDQLRAALVSKGPDNLSPAAWLSKNICDYDAVLTDLRCVIPQLPSVGEVSKEIEERVTKYITSREPGGDSPASIAEDLLKKILDEAATQAYALVQQALADARAEDEMVPALSLQEINVVLAAARNEALAAGNVGTFVRAFTDGMKQMLRSKKDDGIDQAFAINSNDTDDVAARDRAVTTLKREYDVKIDTQVDAAAKSAFADLVAKLDALLASMQKDFPLKRSYFQTMTNLQEEAARAQAAIEQSLQAVQARVAALLAQGDEIDAWSFVDKIREAYKTGGDTQEEKFAAVDKVIKDFLAGEVGGTKPNAVGPKVRNE